MVDINHVTAVKSEGTEGIIGYLTWSSIGEQLITPQKLEELFERFDQDKGYLPKGIRTPDAFRRATNIKEKRKTEHQGVFEHYLSRDVANNEEEVIRHIICEIVDTKGKRLKYEEDAAVLIFERESEQMKWYGQNPIAKGLADQAARDFELYKNNYNGQMIRTVAQRVLQTLAPTPVRPSGGVYFVPIQHGERLKGLNGFISALEQGEAFSVPLLDDRENKDMIRGKLFDHILNTVDLCNKSLSGELKDYQIKDVLENASRVVKDYKDYTHIIRDDIQSMEEMIEQIRKSVVDITANF